MCKLEEGAMAAPHEEQEWFQRHRNTQIPVELVDVTFIADLGSDSEIILARIVEVMQIILEVPKHSWLSENQWRNKLPQWFQDASPDLSKDELEQRRNSIPREKWHELPWQFTGWIHSMQYRGWRWLGYNLDQNILTVYIVIDDSPVYEGTLTHLLRAAGAKSVI